VSLVKKKKNNKDLISVETLCIQLIVSGMYALILVAFEL